MSRAADDEPRRLPLGPTLELMRQVWWLNHALERVSSRMSRSLGITAQQRMLLCCLRKYSRLTASQLASELHLNPGTLSAALARLERRRLLTRRTDPKDRRRTVLELTAAGCALARPLGGTVERAVERVLAAAGPRSLAALREMLAMLTQQIEAEAEKR